MLDTPLHQQPQHGRLAEEIDAEDVAVACLRAKLRRLHVVPDLPCVAQFSAALGVLSTAQYDDGTDWRELGRRASRQTGNWALEHWFVSFGGPFSEGLHGAENRTKALRAVANLARRALVALMDALCRPEGSNWLWDGDASRALTPRQAASLKMGDVLAFIELIEDRTVPIEQWGCTVASQIQDIQKAAAGAAAHPNPLALTLYLAVAVEALTRSGRADLAIGIINDNLHGRARAAPNRLYPLMGALLCGKRPPGGCAS